MDLRVQDLCNDYKFKVLAGEKGISNVIGIPQVSRPGIELAGLFDFYESTRIQVLGSKEVTFLSWISEEEKQEVVEETTAVEAADEAAVEVADTAVVAEPEVMEAE